MHDLAKLRSELRPHGVVSAGCRSCFLFETCGGLQPKRSLLNCFDLNCCGGAEECGRVCPYNSGFMRCMEEVGGLQFEDLKPVTQGRTEVPHYVPVIDHRLLRYDVLNYPAVALNTYRVIGVRGRKYRSVVSDPLKLRAVFGIAPQARIILRGTARDPALERYWRYSERDEAPKQLAALGVSLIIPPNFSHVLDVPRTQNLFNRKRQIICIEQMTEAGLNVAPHLSAVTPSDWDFCAST